jgi:hypothetical protein
MPLPCALALLPSHCLTFRTDCDIINILFLAPLALCRHVECRGVQSDCTSPVLLLPQPDMGRSEVPPFLGSDHMLSRLLVVDRPLEKKGGWMSPVGPAGSSIIARGGGDKGGVGLRSALTTPPDLAATGNVLQSVGGRGAGSLRQAVLERSRRASLRAGILPVSVARMDARSWNALAPLPCGRLVLRCGALRGLLRASFRPRLPLSF